MPPKIEPSKGPSRNQINIHNMIYLTPFYEIKLRSKYTKRVKLSPNAFSCSFMINIDTLILALYEFQKNKKKKTEAINHFH